MKDPRTVRFGIAGVAAASGEARAIAAHPGCSIVAVADRSRPNLAKFTSQYPCKAYDDVEGLFSDPAVDAVFIGTPTQFHFDHTLSAIQHGKHVICAKPMSTNLADAELLVEAAEKQGVWLTTGHTQGFEPPVFKMRDLIEAGEIGRLWLINTWNYNDWIYRGRLPEELDTAQGGGVVYRQGGHQIDIVRWIGGGLLRSVRAITGVWDQDRPTEGIYSAFLEFQDGAVASCTFSGYDHFHTAELGYGVGEGGQTRAVAPGSARDALRRAQASPAGEAAYKASRRAGADAPQDPSAVTAPSRGERTGQRFHSMYGLTVVSGEHGDIRQLPTGLLVYDDRGKRTIDFPADRDGRDVMIDHFHHAIVTDEAPPHDGRWGLASLEVQLAILESGRTRREVELRHQVAARSPKG